MKPPPPPPPRGEGAHGQQEEQRRQQLQVDQARGTVVINQSELQPENEKARENKENEEKDPRDAQEKSPSKASQESYVFETPDSQDWDVKMSETNEEVDEELAYERQLRQQREQAAEQKDELTVGSSPGTRATEQDTPQSPPTSARKEKKQQPDHRVQPEEMFAAVVEAMRATPTEAPRDEWLKTVAELFAVAHREITIEEELVPASKRRYPKLKGDEQALMYNLFRELCVVNDGTYKIWEACITTLLQDLYNTRWPFRNLVQRDIGRVKWARMKPMNQWVTKVKAGTARQQDPPTQPKEEDIYQTYMFNPAVYTPTDISTLKTMCERPRASNEGSRLREGTKEEWRVITGIAEGTIVCRRMPDFMSSILDAKEKLRLYATIQRQVEGELVIQLRSWAEVKEYRQKTREIKEDLLTAAAGLGARVNLADIQVMLTMAKTLSYDSVKRRIHIFFFDRASARKYQNTKVSFQGVVYPLVNVHGPDEGNVWMRQLDKDGVRTQSQREYEIHISNITRFTDIGRLAAYLQAHLAVEFELEDMDECTPNSQTSTMWKLRMKTAECPEFLRGIVRVYWFGRVLILKHPYAKQRQQCFKCGNIGHLRARCRMTEEQLHGEGSREAEDQEIAALEDLARPFASLDEVKKSAATRLLLQKDQDVKAQAAVQPAPRVLPSPLRESGMKGDTGPRTQVQTPEVKPSREELAEAQRKKWVAIPKGKGRKMYAHLETLKKYGIPVSSRYAELDGDDTEEVEEKRPAQPVVEISSGDEGPTTKQGISDEAKARLYLMRAKVSMPQETPQLLALKQRERNRIAEITGKLANRRGPQLQCGAVPPDRVTNFEQIEAAVGIRSVTTPASGNCMAMALAQAIADHNLAGDDKTLEDLTAAVKRGLSWTARLNLTDQFTHFTRVQTLVNLERGWKGMSSQESLKQFRWYLEQYATTPSDRKSIVPRHNWGCSDMLSVAANLLQRNIYVLAFDTDKTHVWHCCEYSPGMGLKGKKRFETGKQRLMTVEECVEAIRGVKMAGTLNPVVMRYWGEHYSAFIHAGPRVETGRTSASQTKPGEGWDQTGQRRRDTEADDTGSQETKEASQDPWDPEEWEGDLDDLKRRLQGMTIPHDLKCEIQHIMGSADSTRQAELLAFLVNTASQLSRAERKQLLTTDLHGETSGETRRMMQKYQISKAVMAQWQRSAARHPEEDSDQGRHEDMEEQEESDSSYKPSPGSSQEFAQATKEWHQKSTERYDAATKRQHTITPMEGEAIRQHVRSKREHFPAQEESAPMFDDWQSQTTREQRTSREQWPYLWKQQSSVWPSTAQGEFPVQESPAETWAATARAEPTHLMHAVQRFAYPDEVLAHLPSKVIIQWTARWRRDCLQGSLVAYRSRSEEKPTRDWLDTWKSKFVKSSKSTQVASVESKDDWRKMKGCRYGDDEVLKLCDPKHTERMAQHILCALIYDKEIRVITGQEEDSENGALTRLVRHLHALKTVDGYQAAFSSETASVDWKTIALFFSTGLQQGPQERDGHY